jgi:hypothetical protein
MSGILTLPEASAPNDPIVPWAIARDAATIAFVTEPNIRVGVEHRERWAVRIPAGPLV